MRTLFLSLFLSLSLFIALGYLLCAFFLQARECDWACIQEAVVPAQIVDVDLFPCNFCPAGESIPIRLFLAGFELTPTMRDVHKKFSVRFYLNLVLIDEEDRRYFKQQEIILWRKGSSGKKAPAEKEAAMTKKME